MEPSIFLGGGGGNPALLKPVPILKAEGVIGFSIKLS